MTFEELVGTLSMREWHIVEQKSGTGMGVLGDDAPETQRAGFYTALSYVVKKRTDPTFKWTAAEDMTLAEVNAVLGLDTDDDEDQDSPKDESPVSSAPKRKRASASRQESSPPSTRD